MTIIVIISPRHEYDGYVNQLLPPMKGMTYISKNGHISYQGLIWILVKSYEDLSGYEWNLVPEYYLYIVKHINIRVDILRWKSQEFIS